MKKYILITLFSLCFSLFTFLNAQIISTVAGSGPTNNGYTGDGGSATAAELFDPSGVAVDKMGDIFICDQENFVIRKVDYSTGIISTVAGNYLLGPGYSGDGGQATAAAFAYPTDVKVDSSGNIYIADWLNNVIRKVDHSTGIINSIAGSTNGGFGGDGGPATAAELEEPYSVAFDRLGNLFIADGGNNRIRKVNHSNGIITTVAGNYLTPNYGGDGGPATAAELAFPASVAFDTTGDMFIADEVNSVIRKVDYSTGIISTVAGNYLYGSGYSGNGGPATDAEFNQPYSIAVDNSGNIYIADLGNSVIREVVNSSGKIETFAGNHVPNYSGDGGLATAAELAGPAGVGLDNSGNLFIADQGNNVIRKVSGVFTGMETNNLQNDITVFPNPNNGQFTLEVKNEKLKVKSIEVYNVLGERVQTSSLPSPLGEGTSFSYPINISSQPGGVYFYRVLGETGNVVGEGKVVIEK